VNGLVELLVSDTRQSLASHLVNIPMGEIVATNRFRIACWHQYSVSTKPIGAPMIFFTLNIADIAYPAAAAAGADSAIDIKELLRVHRSTKRFKLQHTTDIDN
jgi:hypothetical protein